MTTWMKLEGIMLKQRQILCDLTYMWGVQTTEFTETESRLVVARVAGGQRRWMAGTRAGELMKVVSWYKLKL